MRRPIKCGQRFEVTGGVQYILAQVGPNQVCLIGLDDGNRWNERVEVKESSDITSQEWKKISVGYCGEKFRRIAS
jgi:hypothetical protein